jgi:hypothetical protein
MPAADHFSPDYATARERFRTTAGAAGATLAEYVLPDRRGPRGEALAIDVARLGPADADRALLVLSGTHGAEGFCGSGCQAGLLADRLHDALPPTACAVYVHALNPYGFAWLRRVNEDGVDLNRNFVDFARPLPSSAAYEALHDWLIPADWDGAARRAADAALAEYGRRHGPRALQAAITGGQYTRPTGLFYGGTRPTWSARALRRLLQEQLPRNVRHIAVLDLHTGLGPPAYGEPILFALGEGDAERAKRWYGPAVRDIAGADSVSAPVSGAVPMGFRTALPRVAFTYIGLEFGTRPLDDVVTALRGDHWLHAVGAPVAGEAGHATVAEPDHAMRAAIRRRMRDAFYVETPAWQAAVYGRTADFAYRASLGLAEDLPA